MSYNIRIVSTYPPRRCGIGTFARDLATALEHFTAEVGNIRVAAIDHGNGPYGIPVDLVIDQYNPVSWRDNIGHIISRAKQSSHPTVVLLQHEYGLDPDDDGEEGRGTNFIKMVQAFTQNGLTTLVYLHTVLDDPDPHQRKVLQDLAEYSDGLVVTTESAIHILESPVYGIAHAKLKHIDHGIRMQHRSQFDRLEIKRKYGLENGFLITTLGLLSPGKGIQYSLRAYGKFLQDSCTEAQRKRMVYLIGGQFHPEFVKAEGGEPYRQYQALLNQALEESKLTWCKVKDLRDMNFGKYDVVFLDTFLDETAFVELYAATNVMILPYLNMQQISSGILADTLGSGRIAIVTKSFYARELINSNKRCPDGVIIGKYARGILVDPGEPSVEQIALALDYIVFNYEKRTMMEKQAHQRGYQMRWHNSAWVLLQYVDFIRDQKEIVTGRGVRFTRERPAPLFPSKRPPAPNGVTVSPISQTT
jgi:glycosyltransferase involved in cell wall biosynthesis